MFNPTSPVTGSAQTGLTSPTYTLTADTAPDPSGRQFAVTALGGTQVDVTSHKPSSPFTITMFRPRAMKLLKTTTDGYGYVANAKNIYTIVGRKGVAVTKSIATGGIQDGLAMFTLKIEVPAGTDVNDAANLRAMASMFFGTLSANSLAITNTMIDGLL
jgi:hypothetical protein